MTVLCKSIALSRALLDELADTPVPSENALRPRMLLDRCPRAAVTPLVNSVALANASGAGRVFVKDERERMGLGSFKALGAAYVIACDAEEGTAKGRTYVTASAGNHGLSVAAGAQAFGAQAVVYLAETVPEAFADRLKAHGAQVVRHGAIYEEAMAGASAAADENDWVLLSDSSWDGYTVRPHRLMEGYTALMAEAVDQMTTPPTHVFLQAGVGGLAAACAAMARAAWGAAPQIIVVEPEAAPALYRSIEEGTFVSTHGPASDMGRLDCKEASLIALKGLARDANVFALITEEQGKAGDIAARQAGLASTPSGAAGIAGLLAHGQALGIDASASVLVILSEEPAS